jgi:hypothetical protein
MVRQEIHETVRRICRRIEKPQADIHMVVDVTIISKPQADIHTLKTQNKNQDLNALSSSDQPSFADQIFPPHFLTANQSHSLD